MRMNKLIAGAVVGLTLIGAVSPTTALPLASNGFAVKQGAPETTTNVYMRGIGHGYVARGYAPRSYAWRGGHGWYGGRGYGWRGYGWPGYGWGIGLGALGLGLAAGAYPYYYGYGPSYGPYCYRDYWGRLYCNYDYY